MEYSAPWGLARISHREQLELKNFNKYLHQSHGGEGVDVYVIDTGTNYEHVDFEGRASWGKTIPNGDVDEDGNGHGTHCSGTIAGKKYGVAKKASIIAVKVLRSNGSGTMSDVVKGVEWAAESHIKSSKNKDPKFKGSVANMSLGGGKSPALDQTVNAAVAVSISGTSCALEPLINCDCRLASISLLQLVMTTPMHVITLLLRQSQLLLSVPPRLEMNVHTFPTMESVWTFLPPD